MSIVETGGSISNPRSTRRRAHDSDRRSGDSKNVPLPEAGSSSQAVTIVLKDDDDDVQVSSPRSIALAKRTRSIRGISAPTADLELRLGNTESGASVSQQATLPPSSGRVVGGRVGASKTATIDLTSGNDDDVTPITSRKRKLVQSIPEPSKDIHLTCTICMDSMKEETSTVCGHIFCRACILEAIRAQKKCPTCRRKLTNSSIHRIYLSSGSR